ncbi:MAG: DegT/DnrJ/EryC1/StrS family aminotransferase [Myxococcaceae bacterium]
MEEVKAGHTFVPALPTLWPSMLWSRKKPADFVPFSSSSSVRFFYFARNAVWLTVRMLGLEGAEILVPSYHHGVEIEALADAGAKLKFYRVGPHWDVDLDDVRAKLSSKTRAIYLIHYAGFPGPVQQLRALADEQHLPLIEDCALSLLSSQGSRPLGTTGEVGIFCLYKTLPVPNGGAMTLNGERRYSLPLPPAPPHASTLSHAASSLLQNLELRGGAAGALLRGAIRKLGRGTVSAAGVERVSTGTRHFNREHVELGMSPLTLRIAQAQNLPSIVETRRRNYFFLLGRLRDVAPPLFAELPPGTCPLFYPLLVDDKREVMARLAARGVESVDFWRHFHPACDPREFPETAMLRRRVLEIPCHQDLSPEVMDVVAHAVRDAVDESARPRQAHG